MRWDLPVCGNHHCLGGAGQASCGLQAHTCLQGERFAARRHPSAFTSTLRDVLLSVRHQAVVTSCKDLMIAGPHVSEDAPAYSRQNRSPTECTHGSHKCGQNSREAHDHPHSGAQKSARAAPILASCRGLLQTQRSVLAIRLKVPCTKLLPSKTVCRWFAVMQHLLSTRSAWFMRCLPALQTQTPCEEQDRAAGPFRAPAAGTAAETPGPEALHIYTDTDS